MDVICAKADLVDPCEVIELSYKKPKKVDSSKEQLAQRYWAIKREIEQAREKVVLTPEQIARLRQARC